MSESAYLDGLLYATQGKEGIETAERISRRGEVRQLVEDARTTIPHMKNSWRVKTFLVMNMGCIEEAIQHCIFPILLTYQEDLNYYRREYEEKGDTEQFREHRKLVISRLIHGTEEQHPTLFQLAETAGRVKYWEREYDIRAHARELLMNPKIYARCIDLVLPYLSR